MNRLPLVSWIFVLAVGAGADDPTSAPPKPPTILAGRDVCAECGMIINEPRFAAAIAIDSPDAHKPLLFDDVGDYFDYQESHADLKVLARFVRLYDADAWAPAESAWFLVSETIQTPMASGIVAYADIGSCEAASARLGGRVLDHAQAKEARRASRRTPDAP